MLLEGEESVVFIIVDFVESASIHVEYVSDLFVEDICDFPEKSVKTPHPLLVFLEQAR